MPLPGSNLHIYGHAMTRGPRHHGESLFRDWMRRLKEVYTHQEERTQRPTCMWWRTGETGAGVMHPNYNLLASVCDFSERALSPLSGVPRAPSLLSWLDSWDPTARQFRNKEEAYNLWGSVWNEKALKLLDGNAGTQLVTQDFKNACSVTLFFPFFFFYYSLSQLWCLLPVV